MYVIKFYLLNFLMQSYKIYEVNSSPVMQKISDPTVYSLFPHEDLRTGKDLRRSDNFSPQISNLRNYPQENYRSRVLFDETRLNYRNLGHFSQNPQENYVTNTNFNLDQNFYTHRPKYDLRHLLPLLVPAHAESKLPKNSNFRNTESEEARFHVFDPASNSFVPRENVDTNFQNRPRIPIPISSIEGEDVPPGRILIPKNMKYTPPEPPLSSFLSNEDYLDYHTKSAISSLENSENSQKSQNSNGRKILFSGKIYGLVPPSTPRSNSEESEQEISSTSSSTEKNEPVFRESKTEKVHISSLLKEENKIDFVTKGVSGNSFTPFKLNEDDAGKNENGTKSRFQHKLTTIGTTIRPSSSFPYVKKSSFRPKNIFNTTSHTIYKNKNFSLQNNDAENIDSFEASTPSYSATKIKKFNILTNETNEAKKSVDSKFHTTANLTTIKKFRTFPHSKTSKNLTSSIESIMSVHKSVLSSEEDDSFSSADLSFEKSSSVRGLVAKIHAHVSNCPKNEEGAEVICDVHIRKRHSNINPHLTVGWKRKFLNGTNDVIVAVNSTVAYIEEDFHEKFNVTLAPGISPMLRSVLSIKKVIPTDTGTYECVVDDGENKLESSTLLFLCP